MVKIKEFIRSRINVIKGFFVSRINPIRSFLAADPRRAKFIGIIAIAVILPLIVVAALTIQNLSQHASQGEGVEIVDANGIPISTTTDPNVFLKITLPADWVVLPSAPQSNNIFVKQAFAQSATERGYVPCGRGLKCEENIKVDTPEKEGFNKCLSTQNFFFSDMINGKYLTRCNSDLYYLDIKNNNVCSLVPGSNPSETTCTPPQPPIPEDYAFCGSGLRCNGTTVEATDCLSEGETVKAKCLSTSADFHRDWIAGRSLACCNAAEYGLVNDNCTLVKDGEFSDPECSIPIAAAADTTITSAPAETSTPTSTVNILREIAIENKDVDSSINNPPTKITVNSQEDIDHIPWKLNDLSSNQTESTRRIQITLIGDSNTATFFAAISLVRPNVSIPPVSSTVKACTDTDGGKDFYVKGTAIDGNGGTQTDICLCDMDMYRNSCGDTDSIFKEALNEFSCDPLSSGGLSTRNDTYDCPNGCSNGACLPDVDRNADLNKDGAVNCKDTKIALDQFGKEGTNLPTELLNQDGKVDNTTLNAILRNYTPGDTTKCK